MDNRFLELALVLLVSLSSGCRTIYIEGGDNPGETLKEETVHNCLYGKPWSDYNPAKSETVGLYKISIEQNYFHALATVLSLGIYAPIKLQVTTEKELQSWQIK